MGPLVSYLLTQITRFYASIIGAAYLALIVLGAFTYEHVVADGPTPGIIGLLGLLFFLLTWRLAVFGLAAANTDTTAQRVELGFLLLIILLIALQVTGGLDSPIMPVFYLVAAVLVYLLGVGPAIVLTLVGFTTLGLHSLAAGQLADQWRQWVIAGTFAFAFGATVGAFVRAPQRRALRAQNVLARLADEADLMSLQRRAGMAVLNRDHMARADFKSLLDIDQVLADMADITLRALNAHTCVVALMNGHDDKLVARAVSSNEKCPEDYFEADLSGTLLREGRDDARRRYDDLSEIKKSERHRPWGLKPESLLMAPLSESGRSIGVIAVDSQYPGHFGREEERFLERMARQIVAALGRERLYRDVTSERAEFAAFYDLIKKLGSSIDLDTVSRVILESVQDIVAYDFGVLIMVGRENQRGVVEAVAGLPAAKWLDKDFSLTDSLVGWVIGSKTYVHYPDLRERARSSDRRRPIFGPELPLKEAGSLLCLPLIQQNFVTGLLVFGAARKNAFSPYEIKILEVLAVQAAVSLENARVHAEMEQMAVRDGLTGCFNHRHFQEWLDQELHRATRMPIPISLILCDIDNFKRFNDTYGHPVGDEVLKTVAGVLRNSVRKNDLAARYGGEEFALVLLNTSAKDAVRFANRVREMVAKSRVRFAGEFLGVTLSLGVATFPDHAQEKAPLIELADKALYAAKEKGRDRVCHAGEPDNGG